MVGALLFVRSLRNLLAVDAGFRSEGVLAVSLDLRLFTLSDLLPVTVEVPDTGQNGSTDTDGGTDGVEASGDGR